jgi:CheY-like chemotaxis protein
MNKQTIFWADDDHDDWITYRMALEELASQYQIVSFYNGRELLDQLALLDPSQYPSLIILDMNMPVLSGWETLRHLKKAPHSQSIPTVVFTTSDSEVDKLLCRRFQTEMLTKPCCFDGLKKHIQQLLSFCSN